MNKQTVQWIPEKENRVSNVPRCAKMCQVQRFLDQVGIATAFIAGGAFGGSEAGLKVSRALDLDKEWYIGRYWEICIRYFILSYDLVWYDSYDYTVMIIMMNYIE